MGSFDANEAKINKPEATGKMTDGAANTANPFENIHHEMSSKPGRQKIAQADPSDIFAGKSEKQYLAQAPLDTRQELNLDKTASSQDVFDKMGKDGYANFKKLHDHNEQNRYLKELGLTRENISPESMTKSIIEHRRAEEKLPPGASLQDIETNMYKKFYRDVKNGTAPIDKD
jgi:hypothetical protein